MGLNNSKSIRIYSDNKEELYNLVFDEDKVDDLHLLQKELDSLKQSFSMMEEELTCTLWYKN